MRTQREVSSGGVIVRPREGGWDVCLIARRREDGPLVWGLPKGHVEAGEAYQDTAVREVREETGLSGEPLGKIGAITYWFVVRPGAPSRHGRGGEVPIRYLKTVHFFLLRYVEGDTGAHDDEVEDAAWFPAEAALAQLSYDNERKILRNALQQLGQRRAA